MRPWRSSRERVADASCRHLAVSPPRLLAVAAATHAPSLLILYRTPYIVMPFFHFSFPSYAVHLLLYLYSLCVATRIFAFRRIIHILVVAAPSVIAFNSCLFTERFAPHLRRVATISLCVAQPSHLIKISLRSVETLHYLVAPCVAGLNASPRRGRVVSADFHFCSDRQPGSCIPLLGICSPLLLATRLHNEKHSSPLESRRLPSTSIGGGECGGYLLVLATGLRCRRYTSSFDAKSPIYILLLNILSPRVTRVTTCW